MIEVCERETWSRGGVVCRSQTEEARSAKVHANFADPTCDMRSRTRSVGRTYRFGGAKSFEGVEGVLLCDGSSGDEEER